MLKTIDAFPKTLDEFRIRTYQGGIISVFSILCILVLLVSELKFYFTAETTTKMMVDGTRGQRVSIYYDIDFPRMPCCLISVDVSDVSGSEMFGGKIDTHLKKMRLDLDGNALGEPEEHAIGGRLLNESQLNNPDGKALSKCGDCYGALGEGECCNTCDEVLRAYALKGWNPPSLHSITQCAREDFEKLLTSELKEGCNVHGYFNVTKVEGKLHFVPGKIFEQGYLHAEDLDDVSKFMFEKFDNSHKINRLEFGHHSPLAKNPLENHVKNRPDGEYGSYNYYLKVVSTELKDTSGNMELSHQFSITQHYHKKGPTSGKGVPEVLMWYEFDPIMFRIEEEQRGFLQFLTSACAIIGGIFTFMGIIDSVYYSYTDRHKLTTPLSK